MCVAFSVNVSIDLDRFAMAILNRLANRRKHPHKAGIDERRMNMDYVPAPQREKLREFLESLRSLETTRLVS